jgi:uncharacterized protein (TIGR01244 family)
MLFTKKILTLTALVTIVITNTTFAAQKQVNECDDIYDNPSTQKTPIPPTPPVSNTAASATETKSSTTPTPERQAPTAPLIEGKAEAIARPTGEGWRAASFYLRHPLCGLQKARCVITNNFHKVVKDKVYRSKQMSVTDLETRNERHKFRSILNLRSRDEDEKSFDEEKEFANKTGIAFYHIPLQARNPTTQDIETLLKVYAKINDKEEFPLLIHCQAGADRTGFAAALWLIAIERKTKEEGLQQLDTTYGHRPEEFPRLKELIDTYKVPTTEVPSEEKKKTDQTQPKVAIGYNQKSSGQMANRVTTANATMPTC